MDPVDEDKLTPLHEAIQLKQTQVAKFLVSIFMLIIYTAKPVLSNHPFK